MSREQIPQADVLNWLAKHHPELHASAELDRAWVWLCVDLRGDHNKPVRESIKEYGFRFCKRGHAFPGNKTGTWAHSCQQPTGYKRKKGAATKSGSATPGQRVDPLQDQPLSDLEMAMLS